MVARKKTKSKSEKTRGLCANELENALALDTNRETIQGCAKGGSPHAACPDPSAAEEG